MKKIYTIVIALFLSAIVFAQAPQKMSYQAVIRDASNNLVTSHSVGMKISILQGSATGTSVYTETQTPTTNANGLVNIQFGGGTGFSSIDWSTGSYFIQTETDPTGGINYTITGTSQLLSVPYALYAAKAGKVDFNFAFAGLKDITLYQNDSISIPIEVIWIDGLQENVTLSSSGLPNGASLKFSTSSGVVNFTTNVTISASSALIGTYPISIIGTTSSGKVKNYTLNLTINPTQINTYNNITLYVPTVDNTSKSFFASSLGSTFDVTSFNTNSTIIDFGYYYGASKLSTFASSSDYLSTAYDISTLYPSATKNVTTFVTTTTNFASVLGSNEITTAYNSGTLSTNGANPAGGATRLAYLTAGNVYAFKTSSGKYGIFKVTTISGAGNPGGYITFDIKVQK